MVPRVPEYFQGPEGVRDYCIHHSPLAQTPKYTSFTSFYIFMPQEKIQTMIVHFFLGGGEGVKGMYYGTCASSELFHTLQSYLDLKGIPGGYSLMHFHSLSL